MQTISGQFFLTKNVALMLADCIAVGADGCEENPENTDEEIQALTEIEILLRHLVQHLDDNPSVSGTASASLGDRCRTIVAISAADSLPAS